MKTVLNMTVKRLTRTGEPHPSEEKVSNMEWSPGTWRKSTASGDTNCVEVSFGGESVLMRHSRNQHGPFLSFSRPEWEAFLTGVRDGEFDID
jgi:Domain of unknown function (DUF397)